jgi:SSS family solute:Na+ symporter
VPACIVRYGGWSALATGLPAGHLEYDGGRGLQAIAVWYFIALVTLVEPTFYQRCYAARTEAIARKGIWISILFWLLFDLLTTTAGLYARLALPDLTDPVAAFPALAAETLAPFWQGIFLVGLLATIMSTVDSYSFVCAVTLGRDVLGRWRSPVPAGDADRTDEVIGTNLPAIRWSLLATAAVSIGLALWAGSVVRIWHHVGSVATPALLLPLAAGHTPLRLPGRLVLVSIILAGGTSAIWLWLGGGDPYLGCEAIFPGLLVSAGLLLPACLGRRSDARPPGG